MAGRPRQPGQQRVVAITEILLSRLLVFVSFLSAPSPALQHRQQENRSIQLASSLRFKAVWLKNKLKLGSLFKKTAQVMTRDVLVISLLVLWLSLNGLEHLSNVWVDSYSRVTEDGYFATPREADEIADDTKLVASKVQPWTPWSCHQSVCIPSQSSRRQTTFLKQALKIYKLHDVFLI